jgi:hypothetical protein
VPLSVFCASRAAALFFLLVINPLACLVGALYLAATGAAASSFPDDACAAAPRGAARAAALYRELLLRPSHWLASWRLNCVVVAWHARVGGSLREYGLEDKGAFLLAADRLGLAVAPFLKGRKVFVKHRSMEGGQVGRALCWCMPLRGRRGGARGGAGVEGPGHTRGKPALRVVITARGRLPNGARAQLRTRLMTPSPSPGHPCLRQLHGGRRLDRLGATRQRALPRAHAAARRAAVHVPRRDSIGGVA